jgi:Right handed beta helix region
MFARLFCLTTLLATPALSQTTWYVDLNNTPPGTGTANDPYTSIQYAVEQPTTVSGDELLVLPGEYVENVDLLGKSLRVTGQGGVALTTLRAAEAGPTIQIVNGEGPGTKVEGLRIADGISYPPNGGQGLGLRISGSTVEVVDCSFEDNHVPFQGGGLYAENANVTVRGTDFLRNRADYRGGAAYLDSTTASFTDCYFGDNGDWFTGETAGIYASGSDLTLTNCEFDKNKAVLFGAAVQVIGGTTLVQGCLFRETYCWGDGSALTVTGGQVSIDDTSIRYNLSDFGFAAVLVRGGAQLDMTSSVISNSTSDNGFRGGGMYLGQGSTAHLADVVFKNNVAGDGGGLSVQGATVTLDRCTFLNNSVSYQPNSTSGAGSALLVASGSSVQANDCLFIGNHSIAPGGQPGSVIEGPALLRHGTVVANTDSQGLGAPVVDATLENSIVWNDLLPSAAGTTVATYSDVRGGWPGQGNIDQDPLLDGNYQLSAGSPCIDAGNPNDPRQADGSPVDMGANPWLWPAIGANYCAATLNSTGQAASIAAYGVAQAGGQPLFLRADQLPANQFGLFLTSSTQGFVGGVGQGNLCLGGSIARFASQMQSSGEAGVLAITVDTNALPFAPPLAIQPGETWSFQAWFRDANPMPTSNLTDGVAATFL